MDRIHVAIDDMAAAPTATVVGLDWSGAKTCGKTIFVAECELQEGRMHVVQVVQAQRLPKSGMERKECLPAVREFLLHKLDACVQQKRPLWVGVDSAMSVARQVNGGKGTWMAWLQHLKKNHPTPESFREECARLASTSGPKEPKRTCDVAAQTPFAPQNLRMYRQTYYAATELAWPLVEQGIGAVVPMMEPCNDKVNLYECCPASLLKGRAKQLYKPYKGTSSSHRTARQDILDALLTGQFLHTPFSLCAPDLRSTVLDDSGGDALDSLLCAACLVACTRSTSTPFPSVPWDTCYVEEGCVYS